jgi:uncharacterized tellurite resistance protein B-like protein
MEQSRDPVAVWMMKVLSAVAWADGELREEERSLLLEMAAELGVGSAEREGLRAVLERPISSDQFEELLRGGPATLTPGEREETLRRLRRLIDADRRRDEAECRYLALVEDWLRSSDPAGAPATAGRELRGLLGRARRLAGASRELLRGSLAGVLGEETMERMRSPRAARLDPERREFLTLYGVLLTRVMRADGVERPEEHVRMRHILTEGFGFSGEEVQYLQELVEAKAAANADRQHICAGINRRTEMEERFAVLEAMFAMALADGELSREEENEIRLIANYLWIEAQEYVRLRAAALGQNRARA